MSRKATTHERPSSDYGEIPLRCPECNRKLRPTTLFWASWNIISRRCPSKACGMWWSISIEDADPLIAEWTRERDGYRGR